MDAARQISVGFGDMKETVGEILAEKAIEPTNEDVDEMAKQDMMMKMVMKVSRRVQKLSRLQQSK